MNFDLNTLWFVLIAVLFTGFFVLEGFLLVHEVYDAADS